MTNFYSDFTVLESIFLLCAVIGGVLFLFNLLLQFIGLEVDTELDFGFKFLSFQGITAFVMVFGLVGLSLKRDFSLSPIGAIIGSSFLSFLVVYCLKKLFSGFQKLTSSGNIDLSQALFSEGVTYLRIPAKGTGQVQIGVQGRLKILDAVSDKGQAISTGQKVQVVGIIEQNILSVSPL